MKFQRIEGIILTGVYLFFSLILYKNENQYPEGWLYQAIAATIFAVVMGFVFFIRPKLFGKGKIDMGIGATLLLFVVTWAVLSVCFNEIQTTEKPLIDAFFESPALPFSLITFLLLFAYEGIKIWIVFFLHKRETLRTRIAKETFFAVCAGILLFFISVWVDLKIAYVCLISIPYGYCLYALHNYLLLNYLDSGKINKVSYGIITFITAFLCYMPFASLLRLISYELGDEIMLIGICASLLIIPLTYLLYFNQKNQAREVVSLQKVLGQTSADLKLLQSQINPHFLFNVMNTLYGIALQEKAERTAEGIQKLGDMMRFMLHENQQDSILLTRELEYLKEYINLQRLRTGTVPSLQISYDFPEIVDQHYIAPMLLIPFVENAFKHGISLNKPSWVRVQLDIEENDLKFSVYNSIHKVQEHDPEETKSGIGLENVRKRLNLIYPGNHQLNIEKTQQEFFIFLTLKLTQGSLQSR